MVTKAAGTVLKLWFQYPSNCSTEVHVIGWITDAMKRTHDWIVTQRVALALSV